MRVLMHVDAYVPSEVRILPHHLDFKHFDFFIDVVFKYGLVCFIHESYEGVAVQNFHLLFSHISCKCFQFLQE